MSSIMGRPLRIVCVGGGPAGLYFSILMKLANRDNDVIVVERNPPGVTYGWGVVFWDGLLDRLYRNDPASARDLAASSVSWSGQVVRMGRGRTAHLGGSGFSVGRHRLIDILAGRARDLDVDLRFQREALDLSGFADAELIVACDGANSQVRQQHADRFGTTVELGRNRYIWLGTRRVFDPFTFAFERTAAGWIWLHGYRFDDEASTCIFECSPETWRGLGFDRLGPDESMRLLERIFAAHLEGRPLVNQLRGLDRAAWLTFRWVKNHTWRHGRVVLMGDAAHTTHFALGLGTELALRDAIGLATALKRHADLDAALKAYEEQRQSVLRALVSQARSSARWFEEVDRHADTGAVRFAYSLGTRRGPRPWWQYQAHLAMQTAPARILWFIRAKTSLRARRRRRGGR
jgi:anthraniloyl-CoA monooxygenase